MEIQRQCRHPVEDHLLHDGASIALRRAMAGYSTNASCTNTTLRSWLSASRSTRALAPRDDDGDDYIRLAIQLHFLKQELKFLREAQRILKKAEQNFVRLIIMLLNHAEL